MQVADSTEAFDLKRSFDSPLEAIGYACSYGGSYEAKANRAMRIVAFNVRAGEFGFASEVVAEIQTIDSPSGEKEGK